MAVQIAKASGAKVLTTVSTQEKAEYCRSIGADSVIFYREESVSERCRQETGGRGVDAIIEMVASENLEVDCLSLKTHGKIVILGAGTGKSMTGQLNFPKIYSKDIDVRGMSLFNAGGVFPEILRQVDYLLQNKKIKPLVGKVLPLSDAPLSHELLIEGKVMGKIVLEI